MVSKLWWISLLIAVLTNCSSGGKVSSDQAEETASLPVQNDALNEEGVTTQKQAEKIEYEKEDGFVLLGWKTLAEVDFEWEYSEELQAEVPIPQFREPVQVLDGAPVQIRGYVIPIGEIGAPFTILSANPYKQCFFCGGAGPETVMDIILKEGEQRHFDMDKTVTFRGRLQLNKDDFNYLNYILQDAEVLE